MRILGWLLVGGIAMTHAVAQAPAYKPVGNMSQLMVNMIYPSSDAIFYVDRKPPSNDAEWNALASQALILAESGNLLLMPGRARDQGNWTKDTKLMIEAGAAAFKAARAKDIEGIRAVSDALNESCITCHTQYRADYPKRKP
jgi:hypothetical protein